MDNVKSQLFRAVSHKLIGTCFYRRTVLTLSQFKVIFCLAPKASQNPWECSDFFSASSEYLWGLNKDFFKLVVWIYSLLLLGGI